MNGFNVEARHSENRRESGHERGVGDEPPIDTLPPAEGGVK